MSALSTDCKMEANTSSRTYQCVAFDLGDTLFDKPNKIQVGLAILLEFGFSLLNPVKLYRIYHHYKIAKEQAKKVQKAWDQVFGETYAIQDFGDSPEVFQEKLTRIVERTAAPKQEMMQIVGELKRKGYHLAILSNTETYIGRAIRNQLSNQFKTIVLSCDEGNVKKPNEQVFIKLIQEVYKNTAQNFSTGQMPTEERLKQFANKIVFFDDNGRNVEAANRVGLTAYKYIDDKQVRAQLKALGIYIQTTSKSGFWLA